MSARLKPALGGCATAILDAWEEDLRRGEVGTGAHTGRLIYRLKNGITPPDVAPAPQRLGCKPAEYADIILG